MISAVGSDKKEVTKVMRKWANQDEGLVGCKPVGDSAYTRA